MAKPKLRLRKKPTPKPPLAARRASSLDEDIPAPVLNSQLDAAAHVALVRGMPSKRSNYATRTAEIRRIAGQEYITDPEAHDVRWWHGRDDRPYKTAVTWRSFSAWSEEDGWEERRQHFWTRVEQRVLEHVQHELLQQRLREIARITPASDAALEYLEPRRGPDGALLRHPEWLGDEPHPFAGLPVIPLIDPLRPPAVEKVIRAWIDLHKLLMTKRGEVTQRTTVDQGQGSNPLAVTDPVASGVPFSQEQIAQLAQLALRMRQPELEGDALEKIRAYERAQEEADADASEVEDGDGGGETSR